MRELTEGQKAPDFILTDAGGIRHKLSDYLGHHIVLYFYPKDNTSGCTKQACNFRDDYSLYIKNGIIILGISPDSEKSHAGFIEKHKLPFPLLSDPDKKVLEQYGAWGKKLMYGREYMGVIRKTYLIDKDGIIVKIFPKVNVNGHSKEVLSCFGIR